jgi:hypothetical protein
LKGDRDPASVSDAASAAKARRTVSGERSKETLGCNASGVTNARVVSSRDLAGGTPGNDTGFAYLTKSGRLSEMAGRFCQQRTQDVTAVQTSQPTEPIMESSPQENTGDPTRPVSPRLPTAP